MKIKDTIRTCKKKDKEARICPEGMKPFTSRTETEELEKDMRRNAVEVRRKP